MGKDKKGAGTKASKQAKKNTAKTTKNTAKTTKNAAKTPAAKKGSVEARKAAQSAQAHQATSSQGTDAEAILAAKAAAFSVELPEQAFAHFKPLAEGLPAQEYPVFTGQALLMRANIKQALEVLEPHLPAAVSKLKDPGLREIFELPSLVMALDFASGRVPSARISAGELAQMLSEGGPWRELMLSYLEIASHPLLGLLPRERVAAVRAGTGRLDKAQDFVALAGLFAEFSGPLAGKHPFSAESIERLSALGGELVQQLKPGNAIQTTRRTSEALLRDRFAFLVSERYDHLQVLAAVALGKRKADELLPALRSAVATRSEEPPTDDQGAPSAA
jgi:hypothetical protein